jgi:hypothetical protein
VFIVANKTFNTRVKNKRDTAANWEAVATTFQPLDGELIIVDTSAGKTRFKVGRYDTAKGRLLYYNEIPFADEYLYNDLNESQGKIYDKLKGIDDKSIIEMTLEPSDGNGTTVCVYHIGLWQFPKTGLYKIHLTQHGTTTDLFKVFARKTKDDGTLPEDFTQDNLVIQHLAMGDTQVNDLYIQVDYIDNDKLTVYNVKFLTLLQPYNAQVNVYDKTTQKWQFVSATYVQSAKSADRLAHQLTLTKGDTTTTFNGSTAQTVEIPTKTSELTNDSFVSYAEQVLTKDQQNQAKTNLGIDVLTGNTTTVTPTQVKEAILAGRPVAITHVDNTYGNLLFTSFGYSLENNVVVANLVSTYNGRYILADLVGMSNSDSWSLRTTELGTSTVIDNLILDIANNYVKYSETQTIPDEQKAQARTNIGAISEAELAQPDWNQNDATAKDYIKNRICYENSVSIFATIDSSNIYATNSLTNEDLNTFSSWCTGASPVNLKINNTVYTLQPGGFADGIYTLNYNNTAVIVRNTRGTSDYLIIRDGFPVQAAGLSFTLYVGEIKQIDKKYIPDELFTQANWNENNETSPAYIQNRICYEGETVTELGNTAEVWHNLTNGLSSTPISYRMNGKIYKDLTATNGGGNDRIVYNGSVSEAYLSVVNYDSSNVSEIILNYPSNVTDFQFVKIENTVKQIDSKFIHTLDTIAEQDGDTTPVNSNAVMSVIDMLIKNVLLTRFIGVFDQGFDENQKQIARNNIGIKNPFKVTFTRSYGKVSADKTAKEIKDAANNGQFVYGIFDGDPANIYTLNISNINNIRFNRLYTETDSNMGLCYNVFYINNPADNFTGNYEETYCYNITAPSIKVVKVKLDNGTYKFDSTGAGTSYSEIFNMCETSNNNNYTNSDVFLAQGNKLYKLDQNPWSMTIPLVFKRVSYDSTTSSILFETFTINTDSTITYESNTFEQNSTQSDWNENDTSSPAYIQNKPNIPIVDLELSTTSTNSVQNKAVKTAIDSLQASIDSKIDITTLNHGLTQVTNDVAANYVKFTAEQTLTDEQKAQARENINAPSPADAVYTATAASTDGVAYTATVSGIDSLTVGASFIMIPNKASTSKAPTLNVNGLGAKPIRRRLSSLTTSLQQGYSTNWIALNKPFTVVYDGTAWVIEGLTKTDGADVYGAVAQATADAKGNNIADTYATIAMLQSLLPKVTTITLTSNWVGDASPYYQDIALSCVTETSIVDLQPTPEQLNSWQDDGIAFTTLSGNGTVRVYVAGGKPSSAISVQVRVQEVTVI